MKHIALGIAVTGLALWIVGLPAAQQPGGMHGGGMMGGHGMMAGQRGIAEGSPSAGATDGGASVYRSYCATCHGATGRGDGPMVAALNPRPKDFTNCEAMGHESDADLFRIVKEGGQSTGHSPLMPPWGGTLTDDQIRELVGFVRSLCKK